MDELRAAALRARQAIEGFADAPDDDVRAEAGDYLQAFGGLDAYFRHWRDHDGDITPDDLAAALELAEMVRYAGEQGDPFNVFDASEAFFKALPGDPMTGQKPPRPRPRPRPLLAR